MGQKGTHTNARLKDALIKLRMVECALGMGQRSNYAELKNAQIKLKMEECARGMGQHGQGNSAGSMDVTICVGREVCATNIETI